MDKTGRTELRELKQERRTTYVNNSCDPVAFRAINMAPQNPMKTTRNTTLKRVMSR